MAANDPVLEQIATYPWPRGGVQARQVRGGYTLTSARTGAPMARLKPLPSSNRLRCCGGAAMLMPPIEHGAGKVGHPTQSGSIKCILARAMLETGQRRDQAAPCAGVLVTSISLRDMTH
jgi:hypothetical protein